MYDARIVYIGDQGTDTRISPTSVGDSTVTYTIPLTVYDHFQNGKLSLSAHFWIEYKTHTHTYDQGEVTTEPGYTHTGVKTYTCTVCGDKKTEEIAKLTAKKGQEVETSSNTGDKYTLVSVSSNGSVKVAYAGGSKSKSVTIPATVTLSDGTKAQVTAVSDNAFNNNKKVTNVTIGKNVETIGKNSFSGATKLKKVTVGASVTSIGNNAFKGDTALTTVNVKSTKIKTVGDGAFQGDKKLSKISLGKKVTKIGKNAFNGDKKLQKITINSTSLKTVGKNAVKGIASNATIKVPKKKVSAYTKLFKKAGLPSGAKVTK